MQWDGILLSPQQLRQSAHGATRKSSHGDPEAADNSNAAMHF
jgi:hypothetical protein